MKNMKIFLTTLSFVLFSIIVIPYVFASYYDIECKIDVIPQNFKELVTTDIFKLNITLSNIGDKPFPYSDVDVKIFDPNQEIIEDFYSFSYVLNGLGLGENFSYMKEFEHKNETDWHAVYEMTAPGTWEVRITLSPLPTDGTTYTHSEYVTRRSGVCRKHFHVKDKGQYGWEQLQIEIEEKRVQREINRDTRDKITQERTMQLNLAILFLTFITIIKETREFSEKNKDSVIGIYGIIVSIYFSTYTLNLLLLLAPALIFISSFALIFRKDWIKKHETIYSYIITMIAALAMGVIAFSVLMFQANYFYATIYFFVSVIPLFSIYAELRYKKGSH